MVQNIQLPPLSGEMPSELRASREVSGLPFEIAVHPRAAIRRLAPCDRRWLIGGPSRGFGHPRIKSPSSCPSQSSPIEVHLPLSIAGTPALARMILSLRHKWKLFLVAGRLRQRHRLRRSSPKEQSLRGSGIPSVAHSLDPGRRPSPSPSALPSKLCSNPRFHSTP